MTSVTIEQNGWAIGSLKIGKTVGIGRFHAQLVEYKTAQLTEIDFDFLPSGWSEHEIVRPKDTMRLVTKAMQQLFPSVVAQAGLKTEVESMKDGDPVEDLAMSRRPGLSPGQLFEFEDTRRGRKKAIFDLMKRMANLEHQVDILYANKVLLNRAIESLERTTNTIQDRLYPLERVICPKV